MLALVRSRLRQLFHDLPDAFLLANRSRVSVVVMDDFRLGLHRLHGCDTDRQGREFAGSPPGIRLGAFLVFKVIGEETLAPWSAAGSPPASWDGRA